MIKVEVWFDFSSKSSFEMIKKLNEVIGEVENENIKVYYRSFIDYLMPIENNKNNFFQPGKNSVSYETTFAHELFHFAKLYKKEKEVIFDIFQSNYDKKEDINLKDVLDKIVIKNNLPIDKWDEAFQEHIFLENVVSNVFHAKLKKIDSIPHIRINIDEKLIGCQSKENILLAFLKANERFSNKEYCQGQECYFQNQKHLI